MTIISGSNDVGPVSALSRIVTNYTTWAVDDVSYQNESKVQLENNFKQKFSRFRRGAGQIRQVSAVNKTENHKIKRSNQKYW